MDAIQYRNQQAVTPWKWSPFAWFKNTPLGEFLCQNRMSRWHFFLVFSYLLIFLFFITKFTHNLDVSYHSAWMSKMTKALDVVFITPLIALIFYFKAKRLHDVDMSGWWMLAIPLPIVGWMLGLSNFLVPGDEEENRFGPAPQLPGVQSVFMTVVLVLLSIAFYFYATMK